LPTTRSTHGRTSRTTHLKARVIYAARIAFFVDVEREIVEAATIEIDSLEHLDTRLTFRPSRESARISNALRSEQSSATRQQPWPD
jgi:hypothetical protein